MSNLNPVLAVPLLIAMTGVLSGPYFANILKSGRVDFYSLKGLDLGGRFVYGWWLVTFSCMIFSAVAIAMGLNTLTLPTIILTILVGMMVIGCNVYPLIVVFFTKKKMK